MDYTTVLAKARQTLEQRKDRSAWHKGVTVYALELLDSLEEAAEAGYIDADDLTSWAAVKAAMLNGASSWSHYSRSGCALAYNGDIAARLCCPSMLRRLKGGERNPNSAEDWIDVQARALDISATRVWNAIRRAQRGE